MPDQPRTYHPASSDGDTYLVDDTVTATGWQLRPGELAAFGEWLATVPGAGWYAGADGGVLVLSGDRLVGEAKLGDFVMLTPGGLSVEPADGHYQRWAPTLTDPDGPPVLS